MPYINITTEEYHRTVILKLFGLELLKMMEDLKSFCLSGFYPSVFPRLEIKTETFLKHKKAHVPLAVRAMAPLQVI